MKKGQSQSQGSPVTLIVSADKPGAKIRPTMWGIFFEDINFVGRDYKPFDASGWPVQPAGLLGPVRLVPLAR